MNTEIEKIERTRREGKIRDSYKNIKKIRQGYKARNSMIRDVTGNLKTHEEEVLHVWKEYFNHLLNRAEATINNEPNPRPNDIRPNDGGPIDVGPNNGEPNEERPEDRPVDHGRNVDRLNEDFQIEEPTLKGVKRAIKSLKNNRATGIDQISAELLKHGGEALDNQIYKLTLMIWRQEEIPGDWETGVIMPVHKKGDKTRCENYRGITMLPVCYKVLTILIKEKLEPYIERKTSESQCGFRKGRATSDHLFTIRQIMEKCREVNKDIWQLFIDFKQAYDSIQRPVLWEIMQEMEIPPKLINLVKACYSNSKALVQIGKGRTEEFEIRTGLRQGCLLSPILFNLVLEKVKRSIGQRQGGIVIGGISIGSLEYADDVDIIRERVEQVLEMYNVYKEEAKRVGLVINENKTKVMKMTREENGQIQQNNAVINGIEKVSEFKYLGSCLTSNNDIKKEITERIAAGNRCFYSLLEIFKKRYISRTTKLRIYNSIIRPIATYGCESWTLTKHLKQKLLVFENNILRRITGPIFDNEENRWRRRHNAEVREITNQEYITDYISSQRLRWLGHVARMEIDRLPKRVMEGSVEGRRPVGRPRMRWYDNVMEDLQHLGLQNPREEWDEMATDRRVWMSLVRAAMGLH